MKRREAAFTGAALAVHLALALRLRAVAWPEVTTPAYLWYRGLLLYRDVKFVHTPGMMGVLALLFGLLGPGAGALRIFSLIGPLASHGALIRATRAGSLLNRSLASAFFLVLFYGWEGNSVWPVPLIAALALPIARSLKRDRLSRAGILVGLAILLKQTAAYLLILILARLLIERRPRAAARFAALAAAPYLVAGLIFAAFGGGADYFRWTLLVPFLIVRSISHLPQFWFVFTLAIAFLPLVAATVSGDRERIRDGSLLLVAGGLVLMVLPRFDMMQAVAAVPCLALGAFLWLERSSGRVRVFAGAVTATTVLSFGSILFLGETFDSTILFWNSDPALNRLVERVRRSPPGPVDSRIWENVLPRTGRLPPGNLYVHPWLAYYHPIDHIGERIARASIASDALIVDARRTGEGIERCGPYSIWRASEGNPEGDGRPIRAPR